MFHTRVIGAKSRNLDLFLTGADNVKRLFARNTNACDVAVLEGAMGFYDGMGRTTDASAYDLARTVKAPVVLIINGKGAAVSMAALIKGFKEFRNDSNIQGVILNNVKKMTYLFYKDVIEKETGVKVYGYFPHLPECNLESRHLGLVTAGEIAYKLLNGRCLRSELLDVFLSYFILFILIDKGSAADTVKVCERCIS